MIEEFDKLLKIMERIATALEILAFQGQVKKTVRKKRRPKKKDGWPGMDNKGNFKWKS